MTRTVGIGTGRRVLSPAEHRERLVEYAAWFFGDDRFHSPADFLERLRTQAPSRVAQIPEVLDRDRRKQLVIDSLVQVGVGVREAELRARMVVAPYGAPYDTARAVRTWEAIRGSDAVVFDLSAGYDGWTPIAWSARDERFYRLVDCC